MPADKPIVFACAGCSQVAKLAWELAKELDRRGIAEMSCLAGVGARKPVFLKKIAHRKVWVIDGCPIECGLGIFDLIGLPIDRHIRLAEWGFKKHEGSEDGMDMNAMVARVRLEVEAAPCD